MWWDILKVDIDFSDDARGMGHYESWGKPLDFMSNIRINHKEIYKFLKEKLGREPTEKELKEYIKRVIMHESTHAAHDAADDEFYYRPKEQKEYIAFMGQFPQHPYLALKEFLQHPDAMDMHEFDKLAYIFGWDKTIKYKDAPAKIVKILNYVDRWARNDKQKNKLLKLELAARKKIGEWKKMRFPQNSQQMLARYGRQHRKFIHSLHQKPPGGK